MTALKRIDIVALLVLFCFVSPCFGQDDAEQIYAKGVQYGAQGNLIKAKEEFEKTLKADPLFETAERFLKLIDDVNCQKIKANTAIGLFKGIHHARNGRLDAAIGEYNMVLETDPSFSMAFNSRGRMYTKKGRFDQAISDFTKAIELNPKFAVAYFNRGNAYRLQGQFDKAISNFTRAIEINPKFPEAYSYRGYLYADIQSSTLMFSLLQWSRIASL